jgi:presenilin-like A22 family membrane protease
MKMIGTILVFFMLAQILGIFTGFIVLTDLYRNPYVSFLVITTDSEQPVNALLFVLYILFGAVLMMVLVKFFSHHFFIFRILEFVLIAAASSIVFYAFLRLASGYTVSTFGGILFGLLFSTTKLAMHSLKNAAAIFATAGVGVVFGISLGIVPLIFFLIFLSIYDYISVFATKHMVELADFVVEKDLAFTVTAKELPVRPGAKEKRIDLGTGDLIAPIMLEVSALSFSVAAAGLVFLGAMVAMSIFLALVWKRRTVLPALPPIVLGMVSGLLAGFMLGLY